MPIPLRKQLEAHGYDGDTEAFRDLVVDAFRAMRFAGTDEDLLFQPDTAKGFCKRIRAATGCALPDDLILRTLINFRKHGPRP